MKTTYKEIETGIIQRTDIDGDTTTSYRPVKIGDTRTDTDSEGNETTVDLWQEALDSGNEVLLLTDDDKAKALAKQQLQELKAQVSKEKMKGVLFGSVMCSATAKDQFGLASIENRIKAGMEFNFYFENGSTLILNVDNVDAFEQVWYPFRMQFFP